MGIFPLHQDGFVKRACAFFFFFLFISCQSLEASVPAWDADIRFVNFKEHQEDKVRAAISLIRKVITSPEFKDRILNHTYEGKKTFVDGQGLSNAEIYRKIIEGAEKMGRNTPDGVMNVELELYHSPSKTIGYTFPDTNRIWMNTKYFNRYTPVKVADNLMHEWMHKLGFTHEMKYSERRNYSVPYAIGYLIEELAEKHK
jgi:hypothetical protein